MAHIVTAPEYSRELEDGVNVFLAGGITNCPDWQSPIVDKLKTLTPINIFNPRRNNWNPTFSEEDECLKQINWEYDHLRISDVVIFWFPKETLCPITLLEYGKFLVSNKRMVVGVHPEYQRKLDIKIQTTLERPYQEIVHSIDGIFQKFFEIFNEGFPI